MVTDERMSQVENQAAEVVVEGVRVRLVGDTAMFQARNPCEVQNVVAGVIKHTGRHPITMHDIGGVVPPHRLIVLEASRKRPELPCGTTGGWAQE